MVLVVPAEVEEDEMDSREEPDMVEDPRGQLPSRPAATAAARGPAALWQSGRAGPGRLGRRGKPGRLGRQAAVSRDWTRQL